MFNPLKWLKLEPALLGSVAAAVYAAYVMLYRVLDHTGVFSPDVLVAALTALYGLYTRYRVTPLANPKDAKGLPLRSGQA